VLHCQSTAGGWPSSCLATKMPLTSARPIDLLVTELAVIAFPDGTATLMETAPGVSVQQVIDATEAEFVVPPQVPQMAL